MKLIVFSAPEAIDNEVAILLGLFDLGLAYFHLRKPDWSELQHIEFLNQISPNYYSNIILHYHHNLLDRYPLKGVHLTEKTRKSYQWNRNERVISTSFHKLADIEAADFAYTYRFLSPIFDSISKKGYPSAFTQIELAEFLKISKSPVIALGGVSKENILLVKEMGFYGAALLGTIWQSPTPLEEFEAIQNLLS